MNKWIWILLFSLGMILLNYLTNFGFGFNNETIAFSVQIVNSFLFPIGMAFYLFSIAKSKRQKYFVFESVILILSYVLTYYIPFLAFSNFKTFSVNADGASMQLFYLIIGFGLVVNATSIILAQIFLVNSLKSNLHIMENDHC